MDFKLVNRIFAGSVFIASFIVLLLTVQPSVSFWDCGEFIAAGFYLQVPHPPGTPFFLLLGRLFAMLPIAENIAYKVNMISVLSSALSVMLLYLIAVKIIENFKGKIIANGFNSLGTYISAAIGALAFSFSDTFWFNGTEAEVYALSTFLFAAVTYLMMLWNEKADDKDNEKYLLMIAYLIGLSTGVHLMSVLAIVPVVMVILFRKYLVDEQAAKNSAYIFLAHIGVLLLIAVILWSGQKSTTPVSPEEYSTFDSRFKMIMFGVSALIMGVFWKKLFTRNSIYIPLIIGGIALFAVYPGIVKFLPGFLSWMGENIGSNDILVPVLAFIGIIALAAYGVKYSIDNRRPTLHLIFMSFIFSLIGFTTFAMVIIRANQNPPMNENEPNTFTELVSYLNREQYGDFPTFKRRFTQESHQQGVYTNYSSDLSFFWSYQMNHMKTRYLLWNFAGREGWDQDAGANIAPFNSIGNIFGKLLSVEFKGDVKDSLFGIPLLLGLLGIYYHFRKDWKMASVFMVMFILMGYLTAFYQNQQQPQPRERDYFYVGAFFVYAIWIALGARALFDLLTEKIKNVQLQKSATIAVLVLIFLLVPVRMLWANYFTHDRSGNWVPWDYSYNLLQSCAPNAVLFTNGDNDTFPLWYLQDVEGVRRDVKVANLSLLNTSWYINQLKNNDPYKVGTIKLNLTDAQIAQIRPIQWEPRQITIPAPGAKGNQSINDVIQQYNIKDPSVLNSGSVTFTMNNTLNFGNIKAIRVQDIMVREIIMANNWERPIYFAVTCSEDSKIGLSDYLKMEGMGLRLVPEKRNQGEEFINAEMLHRQLFDSPEVPSKDYRPGFLFRGLNDKDVFFDENHIRMTQNFRNGFMRLAIHYVNADKKDLAIQTLDRMEITMPRDVMPLDFGLLYEIGNIYHNAGAKEQYAEIVPAIEEEGWKRIDQNPSDVQSYWNPYRILLDTYENTGDTRKLLQVWQRLETLFPNDPNVQTNIQKYKAMLSGNTQNPPDTVK